MSTTESTNESRTPGPEGTQLSKEQKQMLAKLEKLMPKAKVFEPKVDGKYYGEAVLLTKDFLVQQVGENTVVAHPRKKMNEWPFQTDTPKAAEKFLGSVLDVNYEAGKSSPNLADPDRWLERKARTPAREIDTAIARSHLGQNFGVYSVPPSQLGLNTRYEGIVVAVNDGNVIQRINSRTAMVHEVGAERAKEFGAGQKVAIDYEKGALQKIEVLDQARSRSREAPERVANQGREVGTEKSPEAQMRESFFIARNTVRRNYGDDIKVYDAKKVGQDPSFDGTIVAASKHHVIQRVAAKSFIAHERASLDKDVAVGKFMQIAYTGDKAKTTEMEVRRDREQQRAPEQSRGKSQGMSR